MELTLAHYCISEVQAVELNLTRTVIVQYVIAAIHLLQEVDELVIEWTVRNKLQGTDRVGNTLEIVALSVCEVVHWISVPLGTCTVVRSLDDAVHDWVAEVHVWISHVKLRTKYHTSFYSLRSVHFLKESKAFLDRTVAIWAGSTRGSRSTLLGCNFLCSLLVDISMSLLDHPYSKLPQLLEVIGSIIDVAPLKAEPLDVLEDIFYVFVVFLTWVGVIKSEVADTLVFFGYTEVHADGLGMTDVKIAVRLWWKTGLDSTSVLTFLEVFLNQLFYERDALCFLLDFVFFINCHIL